MRAPRLVLALLLALVLLAGCASMPSRGPVMTADPVVQEDDRVVLVAYGPQPEASAQQIVQGFLRAVAAGGDDDFAVAREYLAGPVAQTWDPLAQVRVYEERDEVHLSTSDTAAVRARVLANASVDDEGRYTEASPDTTIEADFSLARDGQREWRIVGLDDGVLLSPAAFDAQFVQHPLYFLSHDRRALVPETRWYPQRNVATQIVRGLLAGPSPWLAPAVTTALPPSTRLAIDSVIVTDGVAEVDLTAEALGLDDEQTALLLAQINESLWAVPSVRTVVVRSAGTVVSVPDDTELLRNPYITRQPLLLTDEGVMRFTGTELAPVAGLAPLDTSDARGLALPYDAAPGAIVAVIGGDELITMPTAEADSEVLYTGKDLIDPSIDRHGWTWTSARDSDGVIAAVRDDGELAEVAARWLDGSDVLAVRVSRDGARAVVLWDSDGTSHAEITAIVRDVDNTPLYLGEPIRIGETMTEVVDVAWVDEETVAVLGASEPDAERSVHLLGVGGETTELPSVEDAVRITAGTGDRSLLLLTADGDLYERNGLGWTLALSDVHDPAYPG